MRPSEKLPRRFRFPIAIALLIAGASSPAWTSPLEPPAPDRKSNSARTMIQSSEAHAVDRAVVQTTDNGDEGKNGRANAGANHEKNDDGSDGKQPMGETEGATQASPPLPGRAVGVAADANRVPCFCAQHLAHSLLQDQKAIWTSPLRLRARDLYWLAPAAMGTAGLVLADNAILRHFGGAPMAHSNTFSNYGLAALIGGGAGIYLSGVITHDDHRRETGLLAGEAAVNRVIVAEAMKAAFERPRPNAPNAGNFGAGGASFPSEHALAAWSIATVIAHEYPGPLTKLLAYGAAAGISLARVAARDHFPSDVVVGGALGYLIGRYVYGAHHDPDLPGANIGTFEKGASETDVSGNSAAEKTAARPRPPSGLGSPSVPLDSWVYAAFDRLGALGYAPSAYANLRPWTRMECARILVAAGDDLGMDADARVLPDRRAENGAEKGDKEIIGNSRRIADSKSEKGAPGEALRLYNALRA